MGQGRLYVYLEMSVLATTLKEKMLQAEGEVIDIGFGLTGKSNQDMHTYEVCASAV